MADNILSDFGINILEEEIDDVIFALSWKATTDVIIMKKSPSVLTASVSRSLRERNS